MGQLMEPIVGGLTVLIILVGLASPIIVVGLVYYLKKRLDHKQIMAAIEKGTPLSELRPAKKASPSWIKSLTAGIALLIVAVVFLLLTGEITEVRKSFLSAPAGAVATPWLLFSAVLLAIGVSIFIRGLLQRKAERKKLAIKQGIPLSELERPNWITSFSIGIGFLALSLSFIAILQSYYSKQSMVLFGVFLAAGLTLLIRGLMQRKAERKALAIKQGIPLSELERPNWITSLSIGIGFLIFSLALLSAFLYELIYNKHFSSQSMLLLGPLFAIGLAFFIRGLLLRKAERQIRPSKQKQADESKNPT